MRKSTVHITGSSGVSAKNITAVGADIAHAVSVDSSDDVRIRDAVLYSTQPADAENIFQQLRSLPGGESFELEEVEDLLSEKPQDSKEFWKTSIGRFLMATTQNATANVAAQGVVMALSKALNLVL